MALEPQELQLITDIKKDVEKVKAILLGNGEIGALERIRDLEHGLTSAKIQTLKVSEDVKKQVSELLVSITPLDAAAKRKQIIVQFLQTVGTVVITIAPFVWAAVVYAHQVLEKLNAIVPLETLIKK